MTVMPVKAQNRERPLLRSSLDTYDLYLALQAEASFQKELSVFNFPEARSAATILDLGCGNARYSRLLAEQFPQAEVLGCDVDEGLLSRSEPRSRPKNLQLHHGSFESLPSDFHADVMVCRLVAMYLEEPSALARWAYNHVDHVVSIDAADDLFSAFPELPFYGATEEANARRIKAMGGDRAVTDRISDIWTNELFEEISSNDIIVQSGAEVSRSEMHHLMYLHAELATGQSLSVELRDEIFSWSLGSESYLQYGLRARHFRNTSSSVRSVGSE